MLGLSIYNCDSTHFLAGLERNIALKLKKQKSQLMSGIRRT